MTKEKITKLLELIGGKLDHIKLEIFASEIFDFLLDLKQGLEFIEDYDDKAIMDVEPECIAVQKLKQFLDEWIKDDD
jgi:hypothetical protein